MGSGLPEGTREAALYQMGMTSTVRETLSAFLNIANMKEKEKQHCSGWKRTWVVSLLPVYILWDGSPARQCISSSPRFGVTCKLYQKAFFHLLQTSKPL